MNKKTAFKPTQTRARRASATLALLSVFTVQTALANPLGPAVVNGQASFAASGNTLTVTNTPGAIINWQGFSIGANEVTRFVQQNAASSVLNRVISNNPSSILGALQSNGRVFLVNPNGIVFGQGATVDVAGLVATTLNLSNADFLAGRHNFTEVPGAQSIGNAGSLAAQSGGQIYLIAPDVENTGIITAPNGEILLAAGHSAELVDSANPNLRINITSPAGQATNVGQLIAESGSLGLFGAIVRNSGAVSADSATTQGGKVVFKASQRTEISGTATATGTTGGAVQALGNQVGVTGSLDASGANGGGTVLVGGDYQGKNPEVQNATVTHFGADASIKADATQNGDGGKVIVWSDNTTRAYGSISARGGQQGGDGGLVETSGKQGLDARARVDASAPNGAAGTWLLDPTNITVAASGVAALTDVDAFADNTNCTDCTIDPSSINSSSTTVILQATNNITFTDTVNMTFSGAGLTAQAGNDILVNAPIATYGGGISLSANDNSASTATGVGVVTINGMLDTTGGGIAPNGANITLNATDSNPPGPAISINANLVAGSAGDIYLSSPSAVQGTTQGGGTIIGDILTITSNGPVALNQTGNNFTALTANLSGGAGSTLTLNKSEPGPLTINSLSSTGAVSIDMVGQLTQSNAISAPSLSVTAAGSIYLSNDLNSVNTITLNQTLSGGGGITFHSNGALIIDGISNSAVGGGVGDIIVNASGGIVLNGDVSTADTSAGAFVELNTRTGNPISRSAGTITANEIHLQATTGSSGVVGGTGIPVVTSTIGGTGPAQIWLGSGTSSIGGATLYHNGDLNLGSIYPASNAPVSLAASGGLSVPASMTIATGTSDLALAAEGLLVLAPQSTLSGANVALKANRISIDTSGTPASVSATNTAWLFPASVGWNVDLGSSSDSTTGKLELSGSELNRITAGVLRIGDVSAGAINVSAAIAPTGTSTLVLDAGGSITQDVAGFISESNLVAKASDAVVLDAAPNAVNNLAGNSGTGDFSFTNSSALNVAANIDGVSGITTPGMIALSSSGPLTQSAAAGATLNSTSAYLEGSSVTLNNANPVGVIAGQATGISTGDIFSYTSINGIMVTTVNGFSGIVTGSPTDAVSVILNAGSAGIFQGVAAPILAGAGARGLSLITTGPVGLGSTSNNVGSLKATGVASLDFYNAGALAVGIGGNGVTTSGGPVSMTAVGNLTVQDPVDAGSGAVYLEGANLYLGSTAATTVSGGLVTLTASQGSTGEVSQYAGGTVSASGGLEISADNIFFGGTMVGASGGNGAVEIAPYMSGRPIEIAGVSPTPGTLSITQNDLAAINPAASGIAGGWMLIGDGTGAITFKGDFASPGGMYPNFRGTAVSQLAGTVISGPLDIVAGGAITLTEPANQITSLGSQFTSPSSIDVVTAVPVLDLWGPGAVSAGTSLNVKNTGGSILVNASVTAPTILLQGANGITLDPASSLTASGVATIILNAGTGGFYNNSSLGASVLSTPRWLVYAASPASVVKGGLISDFRHYNGDYTSYPPISVTETGNGFIYASTPGVLSVDTTLVSGTASHIYGDAPTAVFGYAIGNPLDADNEDLMLVTGVPAFTPAISSTTPAGAYDVSYLSGLGSAAGYTFTPGLGLPYTVDPATLTLITAALTGTASKTYDGTTTATLAPGNFLLSDFVGSDSATVTQTSGTYDSPNAGSGILVSTTLAATDFSPVGSTSLANYTLPTSASGHIGNITPAPLTVAANNASKVYDAIPYSGGNGVTYSGLVNGETSAVLAGTLTYGGTSQGAVNVGGYTITPGGLTSGNYSISYVDGTLTIGQAALFITASLTGTASKTYDGTTTATLAPGNFLLGGFAGSDSATVTKTSGTYDSPNVGSGILVSTTLTSSDFSPVGSTNLANYTLPISASGPIGTITPAPLSVTANNASKVYDAATFSGGNGATYTGLVNGETSAVLGGALTYGGTSQGAVNAGSYTITPGGLTSGNYAISFVDGQLAITPAPLTVAANASGKTAGASDPLLTYTTSGLLPADTPDSILSGALERLAGETAGVYPINQGTLTLLGGNYSVDFIPADFTISAASATQQVVNELVNDVVAIAPAPFEPPAPPPEQTPPAGGGDEEKKEDEPAVVAQNGAPPVEPANEAAPLPVCK